MASPITIGELTDVPAPNSPINAQFHQEVANRIVHRFATVAAMNASNLTTGSMAYVTATNTYYVHRGGFGFVEITYAASLQALADRPVTSAMIQDGTIVEADLNKFVLNGAWTNIGDTGSNWTQEYGHYKRLGNVGHFHFNGVLAAAGITTIYSALPVWMRPGSPIIVGWPPAQWVIESSGLVQLLAATTAGMVGSWYGFNATFPVPDSMPGLLGDNLLPAPDIELPEQPAAKPKRARK